MANFRNYPDDGIVEFRYDEDVEYLVVSEKEWELGHIFGFSTTSYSVAQQYCYEYKDTDWVITLI